MNRIATLVKRALLCLLFCAGAALCPAEPFVAGYHLQGRFLLLGESLRAPDGGLKPFAALAPDEIATLYHEIWHAYFIETETKRKGPLYRAFRSEVDRLYPGFPADKRMEVHEEAVSDFIDAAIATTVQIKRFLAAKSPERRREILQRSALPATYSKVFKDEYTGYYTRGVKSSLAPRPKTGATTVTLFNDNWSTSNPVLVNYVLGPREVLGPFIRDAQEFGLPVRYVETASRKLRGVVFITDMGWPIAKATGATSVGLPVAVAAAAPSPAPSAAPPPNVQPSDLIKLAGGLMGLLAQAAQPKPLQADVVMATVALPRRDVALVERYLFEGLIPEDPLRAFAEERF